MLATPLGFNGSHVFLSEWHGPWLIPSSTVLCRKQRVLVASVAGSPKPHVPPLLQNCTGHLKTGSALQQIAQWTPEPRKAVKGWGVESHQRHAFDSLPTKGRYVLQERSVDCVMQESH